MPRRLCRLSSSGIYHVMVRTSNWQRIFHDYEDYQTFRKALGSLKA